LLASDFGDAPLPYPTTLAENGAEHVITVGAPNLGATVDSESDGTHSTAADADGADEEGVTFGMMRVGALGATLTVNVQGSAGKLDAWIDFNGDGSWGGPGEHIFASQDVVVGDNNLTFDVTSYAIAGPTYARFRVSTAGGLGVAGTAADGEDYQITINNPAATSGVFGGENTISATADGAWSVFAADMDGDGDMDVLSASYFDDNVAWYENDGSGNFTPHTISTAVVFAESVFAADVDGDGDMDVLSASSNDNKFMWHENDGSQNFTENSISTATSGARSVFVADVDSDGDLDVLSTLAADDKITLYENLSNDTPVNRQIVTPTPASQTVSVGNSFTFDAIYTTDPLDETLTGLGLGLYFDSTQVQFDGLSNVLQTSLFLAESVSINTEDFDADPATDMFVSVA
jgi:hypothetical protein